ncbi:MAG: ferrochelatase [Sinobacterium sp.]|nr:ferrochelatase [Sinobacterium sp.]
MSKTVILLANLGTPDAPTVPAVRAFLREFLSDKRVVEVPRLLWLFILHVLILPRRPQVIAKNYQQLWDEYGDSPLRLFTESQCKKLQAVFNKKSEAQITVDYIFTYGQRNLRSKLAEYKQCGDRVIVLPLYPQYSCSTTAAFYDQLAMINRASRHIPDVYIVNNYHQHPSFQKALTQSVTSFWQQHGKGDHLLSSFHGVPQAFADKGDPYYRQCVNTANNLQEQLGLSDERFSFSFQSRLGKAQWLSPYTDKTVQELAKSGVKVLDVVCPSFSVDCLETLEEITLENGAIFKEFGGLKLRLIPCLNDSEGHINMMADIVSPFINVDQ